MSSENENTLQSVNFFKILNANQEPCIILKGEFLFDTNFFPDEMLKAEIYEGKIVITRACE